MITETAGTNHIDVEECERRGIVIYSAPTAAADAVSEHALGLVSPLINLSLHWRTDVKENSILPLDGALCQSITHSMTMAPPRLMAGKQPGVCHLLSKIARGSLPVAARMKLWAFLDTDQLASAYPTSARPWE